MTNLRSALDKYLSMRKGLGYKYEHQTRRLADFVAFMEKRKTRIITTKVAMEWATLPPDRHASWALRLSDVRGFARHVANFDPRTEVPPVGMLPGWKRAKPYVYSDAEIDALLTAALALPPEDGLRRWTYHTLFGLIAVTGMRISEAMGLERDDIDLDAGVLTVRLTKFGKSRLVPLHPTTRTALLDYAHRRDALLGSRCGSTFFVAEQGGRLLTSTFIASSGDCPERSGCDAQVIVPGRACTTSVIASPSGRCSTGIAKARMSSSSSQCSPLTSATPACAILTGISRPAPS
jgi:integrase